MQVCEIAAVCDTVRVSEDGDNTFFDKSTEPATVWHITEKGSSAGAATCSGHEHAACQNCADFVDRKGCPICFW